MFIYMGDRACLIMTPPVEGREHRSVPSGTPEGGSHIVPRKRQHDLCIFYTSYQVWIGQPHYPGMRNHKAGQRWLQGFAYSFLILEPSSFHILI